MHPSIARLGTVTETQCKRRCPSGVADVRCNASGKASRDATVLEGTYCTNEKDKALRLEEQSSCCAENDTRLPAAPKETSDHDEKQPTLADLMDKDKRCLTEKDDCCSTQKADCSSTQKDDCCSMHQDFQQTADAKSATCVATQGCGDGIYSGNGSLLLTKAALLPVKTRGCCTAEGDVHLVQDSANELESKEWLRTSAEACSHHLQNAFDEYTSQLERGLCICRGILERLDSCCGNILPPNSVSKPCTTTKSAIAVRRSTDRRPTKDACSDACCGEKASLKGSLRLKEPSDCSVTRLSMETSVSPKRRSTRAKTIDVENDAAREHIVYRVSGMTCTSCSKKVSSVLNNIDGVSSVKVTFVTGIAEFDLNPTLLGAEQVLPRIERETGFQFSRIVSTHQSMSVQINPTTARNAFEELEKLVDSIKQIDKTTYRVNYDPTVVGARDLLSSVEGIKLAPPGNDVDLADGRKRLWKMAWSTGLAALFTIPIVVLAWSHNPIPYSIRSVVSLVLGTFVQAIAVPEFYLGAIKSLVYSRVLEMDMLVVISITAAYGYSVIAFALTHAGCTLETGEFFETGALLISLVLLGRLIAAIAKVRAISTVSLRSLQAEKAVLVDHLGDTTEIDARLLQFGDIFYVPAHARIVTDGEVLQGQGAVDESMLTGESVPVPKSPGDEVIAGTVNGPSSRTVQMTRLPGKNSIMDIANLVENALASKPRIQDIADKLASYFIPIVIALSLIVFVIWLIIAIKGRGEGGVGAVGIAITYGIAVLAISCPCALGLAVPMVLVIAGSVAAKSGIIIKQADAIERGFKVTDVVFDKTGTLTKGDLAVVHSEVFDHTQILVNEILALTKALVKGNTHPVSLAVANHGDVQSMQVAEVDNVQSIPGSGVQCLWRGSHIKAGNPYWLKIGDRSEITTLADRGMTLFCVTVDSTLLAAFGLKSTIRDESKAVVEHLNCSKIQCHVVSGDGPRVVEDVAQNVGIPLSNVASRKKPAEKQEYVKALMSDDRVVLFCGDGTNDAVAVAQANVGVQIGTTSDVTRATADVVLRGGLDGVPALLGLSKRSFCRITFNFVWSAIYNIFAILLASGAFVRVRIPPAYAGLGEIVSVLPVIAVALSLARNGSRT